MRESLLDFELELSSLVSEEVTAHDWGRSFLSPSLPSIWDANLILIERPLMSAAQVVAAADDALSRFRHRTVVIRDAEEGLRLGNEIAALPGWEREVALYMAAEAEPGGVADAPVRETAFAGCEALRRELVRGELPGEMEKVDEIAEQLLEWNRRMSGLSGDRWFVAPAHEPASACCLLTRGGTGQIEEVGTLSSARGRGLAQAVVLAALAASRRQGNRMTFLTAAADDWPLAMYEKLGFRTCGELTTMRRVPT